MQLSVESLRQGPASSKTYVSAEKNELLKSKTRRANQSEASSRPGPGQTGKAGRPRISYRLQSNPPGSLIAMFRTAMSHLERRDQRCNAERRAASRPVVHLDCPGSTAATPNPTRWFTSSIFNAENVLVSATAGRSVSEGVLKSPARRTEESKAALPSPIPT